MTLDWILSRDNHFRYQLLDRMRCDCDYYLGHGQRSKNHLWAMTEKAQIAYMKSIWNSFAEDKKPEWLTWEQILKYEKNMVESL